jgi:hypothetical protein
MELFSASDESPPATCACRQIDSAWMRSAVAVPSALFNCSMLLLASDVFWSTLASRCSCANWMSARSLSSSLSLSCESRSSRNVRAYFEFSSRRLRLASMKAWARPLVTRSATRGSGLTKLTRASCE